MKGGDVIDRGEGSDVVIKASYRKPQTLAERVIASIGTHSASRGELTYALYKSSFQSHILSALWGKLI